MGRWKRAGYAPAVEKCGCIFQLDGGNNFGVGKAIVGLIRVEPAAVLKEPGVLRDRFPHEKESVETELYPIRFSSSINARLLQGRVLFATAGGSVYRA